MKYIIAMVQPSRLAAVKQALSKVEVFRLTVSDVQGLGRQKGHTEIYRGSEYEVSYLPKLKIEVALDDSRLDETLEAITNAARTGKIGDGKIFVLEMSSAVRIRTGEADAEAL